MGTLKGGLSHPTRVRFKTTSSQQAKKTRSSLCSEDELSKLQEGIGAHSRRAGHAAHTKYREVDTNQRLADGRKGCLPHLLMLW